MSQQPQQNLRIRVEHVLHTIGSTPVEQQDPNAEWHLRVDYPPKSPTQLHIIKPKAVSGVLVLAGFNFDPLHRKNFDDLSDFEQAKFMHEFRMMLVSTETDFNFVGQASPDELPTEVQVSALRYSDGITVDSLARTIGATYKIMLGAIWHIQHSLGGSAAGGSDMRFKRVAP